jgi:hypothetical protein
MSMRNKRKTQVLYTPGQWAELIKKEAEQKNPFNVTEMGEQDLQIFTVSIGC